VAAASDPPQLTGFSRRLWSGLAFLFIADTPASKGATLAVADDVEFGHGFAIAGALLVHVLNQRDRLELLGFTYHVLNVAEYECRWGCPTIIPSSRLH
jgi:hypothetical protein